MVFPTLSADTTFHLGALAKSKRGQTYATLNSTCNAVFQLTGFDAPLHVPFAAGVYQEKGDETRINLDVVIEGELLQSLTRWTSNSKRCLLPTTRRANITPWSRRVSMERACASR